MFWTHFSGDYVFGSTKCSIFLLYQELEDKTATKISIPKAAETGNDKITISGTKEGIEKAIHEIRITSERVVGSIDSLSETSTSETSTASSKAGKTASKPAPAAIGEGEWTVVGKGKRTQVQYRVTIQVVSNLSLTANQR